MIRRLPLELKQLEHFIAVAELGSTNQAAKALYTSQPNVSKMIRALEKELDCRLFERTNKGAALTPIGQDVYEYAKHIIKNTNVLSGIAKRREDGKFSISCYPSHMITRVFCDFYKQHGYQNTSLELLEGTIEEITENVRKNLSEIGIVYYSKSQKGKFRHLLGHKKLELVVLSEMEACVYVGKNNPLYHQKSIPFSELSSLKFIQMQRDFFSMEHDIEHISMGLLHAGKMYDIINTNSDNLLIDMLLHTDVCNLGIQFLNPMYTQYDIHSITLEDCEKCLLMGYIKQKDHPLSGYAKDFLKLLSMVLKYSE
jgi:DNA-binding transcriptional LysR family regulator